MNNMMTFMKIKKHMHNYLWKHTGKWLKENIETRAYPWEGSETQWDEMEYQFFCLKYFLS